MDIKKQGLKVSPNSNYGQLITKFGENRIKLNEQLKFYTFSNFNGSAEAFFIALNQNELIDIINSAREANLQFQVFGAGTKIFFQSEKVKGLVIKNRTSSIKIGGVKGKVSTSGIGVEEALVEIDSGVSLGRLNQFLESQKLPAINFASYSESTLGGSIFTDVVIHSLAQSVRIFENGEIIEIDVKDLKSKQIVLSAVLKIRA